MTAKQKLHQTNLSLWMARFNAQAASGLTIREWCSQNSISVHAYNYWKHIAKESYIDSVIPDIVPLETSQPSSLLQQTDSSVSDTPVVSRELRELSESRDSLKLSAASLARPVSIVIDDTRIEIGANASDEMIISILKAVRHA